jgi:microsomal epoxide hydrolase
MSFSSLPSGSNDAIQPFTLHTPREELDELKMLVGLSKIAVPTFENSHKDGKYGIDRDWMQNIKEKWINFDW